MTLDTLSMPVGMPWNETSPMDEKLRFIALLQQGEYSMTELCAAFGISRKTGYKWRERYAEGGPGALVDRPPIAKSHPFETDRTVMDLILEERRMRPTWGPRKIVAYLERKWPEHHFPAHSTVASIFKRHGLSKPRRRRAKTPLFSGDLTPSERPNAVWCADFKGHFALGDRKRCYPLTITDNYSRYLLHCEALLRTDFTATRNGFIRAFQAYGMPEVVRTDNGTPFATNAPGGLSRLSVLLIKIGVRPERIKPGKPTQNGRHERMHRTLKQEVCRTPASTRLGQQRAFEKFRIEFNEIRPHQALENKTPAALYQPSHRPVPDRMGDPEYPDDFDIVRVRFDGSLKHEGHHVMLTELLSGERVGIRDDDERGWTVFFGPIELGTLERRGRFVKKR